MEEEQNYKLGQLIQSISKGNIAAVSKLYSLVGQAMKATAFLYFRSLADVEDIVQDALVVIVEKAKKFRTNTNACAWIYTIVSNLSKNKLGYLKRRKEVAIETVFNLENELNDEFLIIKEIFGILSEKEKKLIVLRYWYDCSYSEIAKIFYCSKTNISYKLDKTISKIKNFYKK